MRIIIAIMIGFTARLSEEQNETLWMYICVMNLANCFPLKVFSSFVENLNNVIANGLLFWISFVFLVM